MNDQLSNAERQELETLRHLHAEAEQGAELMNADKAELTAQIDRLKARVAELEAERKALVDSADWLGHFFAVGLSTAWNCGFEYDWHAPKSKEKTREADCKAIIKRMFERYTTGQTPEEAEAGKPPEQPTILHHPV
jgi:DNA repair exonuclease SbcCD ATPase subunit